MESRFSNKDEGSKKNVPAVPPESKPRILFSAFRPMKYDSPPNLSSTHQLPPIPEHLKSRFGTTKPTSPYREPPSEVPLVPDDSDEYFDGIEFKYTSLFQEISDGPFISEYWKSKFGYGEPSCSYEEPNESSMNSLESPLPVRKHNEVIPSMDFSDRQPT